jgi:ABC-2 type transport system ATP-binding protein
LPRVHAAADHSTMRSDPARPAPVEVTGVTRVFGERAGVRDVDLRVDAGAIHGLVGPNGAGKTTLLRILAGLLVPTSGDVRLAGLDPTRDGRRVRARIGLVPAGDRSFYLRLSALENLLFFARLHGWSARDARARSLEVLAAVGLEDVARAPRVGLFSHGMQKRLSVARALLTDPSVLLVDEATHDLDPEGADVVRRLVGGVAARGAAIVWATQRLDELRGFATAVTLLHEGSVRFQGSVDELARHVEPRRYVLQLRNGGRPADALAAKLGHALDGVATLSPLGADGEHFLLDLAGSAVLGEAVRRIVVQDVDVVACRNARSELEEAFLAVVRSSE